MAQIRDKVGPKQRNDRFDVAVVQKLLAAASDKLKLTAIAPGRTDGVCDGPTVEAIRAFQGDVMKLPDPDGSVWPNAGTWRRLVAEAGEVNANPTGYPERPASVLHLGDGGRDAMFTTFVIADPNRDHHPGYRDVAGSDDIKILNGWEAKNIGRVKLPQLGKIRPKYPHGPRTRFHNLAAAQLQGLWQAWEDAGLLDRVKTFNGGFNARYKRKAQHVARNLSNHSWGTAFDINVAGNRLKETPAIRGERGCVFELVPLAAQWGFYWGGWFGGGRPDGMHFEVYRRTETALSIPEYL